MQLQFPFKGLEEELVVSRTREAMLYKDFKESKVAAAGIEVRTGRKRSAWEGRGTIKAEGLCGGRWQ